MQVDKIHGAVDHKHSLADISDFEYTNEWYGISWQVNQTAPGFTRIAGNMNLHNALTGLPLQQLLKRCLVTAGGTVAYLHPTDSTRLADGSPADLSGAAGNVMVEVPEHYYKAWMNGDVANYAVSVYPLSGFTKIPKHYTSAYEASLNRATGKAGSVVNLTADWRGGNNNAAYDGTSASLLGKPVTTLTRAQERSYCEAIGSGWCEEPFEYWSPWRWLCYIEYATRDLQQAVNNTLTAQGYRQGGLGAGITDAVPGEWNTFNAHNPFCECGKTNSLGNASGEVSFTVANFGGAGVNRTFKANSYRGIENPFGHIWKRLDGINIKRTPTEIQCWVKNGVSGFANDTTTGYTRVNDLPVTSNYILSVMFTGGNLLPRAIQTDSPSSSKVWCDYFYSPGVGAEAWFAPLSSAAANNGANAGLAYVFASYSAAHAYAYFGFRLCFKA